MSRPTGHVQVQFPDRLRPRPMPRLFHRRGPGTRQVARVRRTAAGGGLAQALGAPKGSCSLVAAATLLSLSAI
jgi:hypothetical protein